jgi:CTP:molybdopterin cytidylyltransferase MocA
MTPSKSLFTAATFVSLCTALAWVRQDTARPAIAPDPIEAVLEAYRSHSLAALCEGEHGNEQAHPVHLSLTCWSKS